MVNSLVSINMNKDTKLKGDLAEVAALKRFITKGYQVLKPFGDGYHYDLVIVESGDTHFAKVQCKSATITNGAIHCNLMRKEYVDGVYKDVLYKNGDVDYFAIYCQETDKVYLIEWSRGIRAITLRVESTKNNQLKGVVWAKDFEI